MEKREEEQILSLFGQVPELRGLYAEHQALKKQLDKLNRKHHLTPDEELEKKRIQKLKLAGKDRMMTIVAALRGEAAKPAQAASR